MSLFNMYEGKVIYIKSANAADVVIDWGFGATIKKTVHLSDLEYNPNLTDEDRLKLREARNKFSELTLGKKCVVRLNKSARKEEFYIGDIFVSPMGIPNSQEYTESTPAGEFVNVHLFLKKNGYLKE